jgi:hypothetical protein
VQLHAANPFTFVGEVVSLDTEHELEAALRTRVFELERRTAALSPVLRLVLALLRVSGFELEHCRVADERGKRLLLGAARRIYFTRLP